MTAILLITVILSLYSFCLIVLARRLCPKSRMITRAAIVKPQSYESKTPRLLVEAYHYRKTLKSEDVLLIGLAVIADLYLLANPDKYGSKP